MIQEFRCTILRLTGGHSDSSASTLHRLTFSRNFIKLISASTIPQAPRSRLHSASATGGAAEVRHCFWRFGSKRLPFSISIGHASPDRAGARPYRATIDTSHLSPLTSRPSPLTSHHLCSPSPNISRKKWASEKRLSSRPCRTMTTFMEGTTNIR